MRPATKTIRFTQSDFGCIKSPSGRSKRESLELALPADRSAGLMPYREEIWRSAMINKLRIISFVVVGLLAVSFPLFAHHGNAAYDTEKRVTVKGTVTQWAWSNPHCVLQLDVTNDSGKPVHWVVETENPSSMVNTG